jgi:glyoxylase-like metal-dependent hydrolase (beta-lactamase superfamily II)
MIDVIATVVGSMKTNCYFLIDKKSKKAMIIDPGDDADYLQRLILDNRLNPEAILATHGHFDHLLAAAELKINLGIPLMMSKKDEFLLKKLLRYSVLVPKIDKDLKDSDEIDLGATKVKVIESAGHTPGCLSFYCEKSIFVGDTFFADGSVGRVDFDYSSVDSLERSVERLKTKARNSNIYPGHGPAFRLY